MDKPEKKTVARRDFLRVLAAGAGAAAATTAAAIPYTGLPQTDNSSRSRRSDASRTRWTM